MDDSRLIDLWRVKALAERDKAYWQWVADQIHVYNNVVRGQRTGGCHEVE